MKEGEVADKNRGRSVDDGQERPEDVDEELEALDADEDFADDDTADDDTAEDTPAKSRKKVAAGASAGPVARSRSKEDGKGGSIFGRTFGRLGRFIREIVAELQKVIWPTRKELLTYTTVVVVFVAVMMTFVSLLDLGFAKVMFLVFGGGKTGTAPQ
jgi:preprotein translocase subunit SecE